MLGARDSRHLAPERALRYPRERHGFVRSCVALAPLFFAASLPLAHSQEPLATVRVQIAPRAPRIPQDFVGLSLEVSPEGQGLRTATNARGQRQIVYALGRPGAANRAYFQLMRDLGRGTLRLGGNSQDNTCWDRAAAPRPDLCQAGLDAGMLQSWADAARATGWKVVVGVNLKQDDPAWALREVDQGIARYLPPRQVLALEIGNEPEFFVRAGARPPPYGARQSGLDVLAYVRRFAHDPIAARYAIAGPAACCLGGDAGYLATWLDTVGPRQVALATVHSYFGTVCGTDTTSLGQLLDAARMDTLEESARRWAAAAKRRGVPISLDETNSVSCGGMPGVSDAFGAAAWGLDWLFTVAEAGYQSVNFHTSYRAGGSSYSPIQVYGRRRKGEWVYDDVAEPLFYAMYAFAQNASGRSLLPVRISTRANVKAYAVSRCTGCAVTVFLINKDLRAHGLVAVSIESGGNPAAREDHWRDARLLRLWAPALSSGASQVRYGGAQFDRNGLIRGVKWQPVRGNGAYRIRLRNASIAILRVPVAKP